MANVHTNREWRSRSGGVMPEQVKEANADLEKAGISSRDAYYEPGTGDLVMPAGHSKSAKNRVLEHIGMFDKDACYSDRTPNKRTRD